MSDATIVTVYSRRFSVPCSIIETGLGTVKISYYAPGEPHRADWFYALGDGPRGGRRMGDQDDVPIRYSAATSDRAA